jgi:probable F420-dependent oxidoreductase
MDLGIATFPTHDSLTPGAMAALAEERGFHALLFAEHTHIPASDHPVSENGEDLPRKYWHTYDLFVAMTAAAAATSRLRVGSSICLVIERDPIITAKEVASIDHLSGGRVDFGVGAGWNRQEMSNHGTNPAVRWAVLAERVEAMKAIWTQDEASFHGKYVSFEPIWSWPKPAQRPHPPVLVGGYGPHVLDRVLAFGDGWFPNYGPPDLVDRVKELRARADRPIEVHVANAPTDPLALEQLEKAGVKRAVRWIPAANRGPVERALDQFEAAVAEAHGE